jgi:H+-translocating NAD(P) transhydrogenase subunit alpha
MARLYIQVSSRKARHETHNAQQKTNERHFAMITLSILGQLDLISAATGNVPAAGSELADPFVFRLSIFVLAVFVGYYVVWSVTPALHTPLMSVTNAISSVIVVGALLAVGVVLVADDAGPIWARALGLVALTFASVNIFGGFLVTQRMLGMFQRKQK